VVSPDRYVSFPWYDLDEMHDATDALWRAVAKAMLARGIADVPPALDRSRPHGTDGGAACLFTQTCGYPLFTTAHRHFTVLGAPHYAVAGAVAGTHRSFIVVRAGDPAERLGDLRGRRFAINERDSNSGMNLPRRLFAPLARAGRFFTSTVVSGSHVASATAVACGDADAAAIDCITFALLARYRPQVVGELRVLGETFATATPPFVTSSHTDARLVPALRDAIDDVLAAPEHADVREATYLRRLGRCDAGAYDVVMSYEREAIALGYPVLA